MIKFLGIVLKAISTEDPENQIFDPVRVLWLLGGLAYLGLGLVLGCTALRAVWFLKTVPSFTDMGTGFAAWGAGFGAYVFGGAAALYQKAKADATGGTVTETVQVSSPPAATKKVVKTTKTEGK